MKRGISTILLVAAVAVLPVAGRAQAVDDQKAAEETALSKKTEAGAKEAGAEKRKKKGVRFLHNPPAVSGAGRPLVISGRLNRALVDELLVLRYRKASDGEWVETRFKRSSKDDLIVRIDEDYLEPPGVAYYIAIVPIVDKADKGGGDARLVKPVHLVFTSAEKPHRVLVHGYSSNALREKRLKSHKGRLSRLEARYGYTDFGLNLEDVDPNAPPDGADQSETSRGNVFHELSLGYTYRLLTYLYAIRVEIAGISYTFKDFRPLKHNEEAAGMYYISPSLEFEFAKYFGSSVLLRFGISEEGFEGGGGASIRLGRINGTRMDVGFEGVTQAGWSAFLRFTWDTVPYVPMFIHIERTQWYAAESYAVTNWGSRMFYEARLNLPGGLGLIGRIGYAARDESTEGGLVAGGGLSLDF